jgi:hypothetical protein
MVRHIKTIFVHTYRKSIISAISDASMAIDVWEFFPNTSTNMVKSIDRVCAIFQMSKTVNTQKFNEKYQSSNEL